MNNSHGKPADASRLRLFYGCFITLALALVVFGVSQIAVALSTDNELLGIAPVLSPGPAAVLVIAGLCLVWEFSEGLKTDMAELHDKVEI
jgi:hypothetical protein